MMDLAVTIATFGLVATGLGALVRVAPWPASWLAKKPLSCAACVAGHAAWISMVAAWMFGFYAQADIGMLALAWLGATGLAVIGLAQTGLFVQGFSFEPEGRGGTSAPLDLKAPHGP